MPQVGKSMKKNDNEVSNPTYKWKLIQSQATFIDKNQSRSLKAGPLLLVDFWIGSLAVVSELFDEWSSATVEGCRSCSFATSVHDLREAIDITLKAGLSSAEVIKIGGVLMTEIQISSIFCLRIFESELFEEASIDFWNASSILEDWCGAEAVQGDNIVSGHRKLPTDVPSEGSSICTTDVPLEGGWYITTAMLFWISGIDGLLVSPSAAFDATVNCVWEMSCNSLIFFVRISSLEWAWESSWCAWGIPLRWVQQLLQQSYPHKVM